MRILIPIFLLFLISCNFSKNNTSDLEEEKQTLDFGAFSIETPKTWKKINVQGVDSYVGGIAIDEKDTLFFDLGWYSNKLNDETPTIIQRSWLNEMENVDTTEMIIVDKIKNLDYDKFKKQNLRWDTIDNYLTKITFPISTEKGITGIYIDSLWINGSSVDRFNLYGTNLKSENEKVFLKTIHTIKFKNQSK